MCLKIEIKEQKSKQSSIMKQLQVMTAVLADGVRLNELVLEIEVMGEMKSKV